MSKHKHPEKTRNADCEAACFTGEASSSDCSVDPLSDEFFEARHAELEKRVKPKRLKHIEGVADTAVHLAHRFGADERKARLAGLLHDWDKGYDDAGIRRRVSELGMEDEVNPWVVENIPRVLHGPTAACALSQQFPCIPKDVLDAIYKHTTASEEMSDLAKIIYIADALEPTRKFDKSDYLRDSMETLPLDRLYLRVYKFWIMAMIEHDCVLHPSTLEIWNDLAMRVKTGEIESDYTWATEGKTEK